MTGAVANPAESPVAQRFKALTRLTTIAQSLDHAQIAGGLPPEFSQRLAHPRYRSRLERRFVRRTELVQVAAAGHDDVALRIASLGEDGLRDVIIDTGLMCQYAALRRIVDRSALSDLSKQMGVDLAGHDARRADQGEAIDLARAVAAPEVALTGDAEAVIDAVLQNGLQCWNCWTHRQPPVLARFLNALLPSLPEGDSGENRAQCRPGECRRRADLFSVRLNLVPDGEMVARETD